MYLSLMWIYKWVTRNRKLKEDNDQKKGHKHITYRYYKTLHSKLKIEQRKPH
jgi:hypothetical protein